MYSELKTEGRTERTSPSTITRQQPTPYWSDSQVLPEWIKAY